MKKIVLILWMLFICGGTAQAELYHGINIDEVYKNSDWQNKEDIKKLIDDYTLLLEYQAQFDACPLDLAEALDCYDNIAEKIVTNLYMDPEVNLKQYKQLKTSFSEVYGLKNCRNKYAWPAGNMCEIASDSDMRKALKTYIEDLISFAKEKMFSYSSILEAYE